MKASAFVLVLILILHACPAGALAQTEAHYYIGLFADEDFTVCSVDVVASSIFEAYVWCRPDWEGMVCVEFKIAYPSNVLLMPSMTVKHDGISVEYGDVESGISTCFHDCRYDQLWVYRLSFVALETGGPDFIRIEDFLPEDQYGGLNFAACQGGFPTRDAIVLNHLALNQDCVVGTAAASWGAIKSLCGEDR